MKGNQKRKGVYYHGQLKMAMFTIYSARHRLGNGRLIEILTSMLHFIEKVIYLFKKNNSLLILI